MGKYKRHREFEVHLTTYDGAQHLRLHGWLKRNDILVRSEGIQGQKSALFFGSFIILINDIMLEKLKIENEERGLYCDINVMNSEKDRWDTFQKPENLFNKIQDFLIESKIKELYEFSTRTSYKKGAYSYASKGVFEIHLKKFLGNRAKNNKDFYDSLLYRPNMKDLDNIE